MSDRVQLQAASGVRWLDYDPCPADVPSIRAVAARLRERAAALGAAAATLSGWAPVAWQDAAAHATVEHLARLVGVGLGLRASLERGADALDGWAEAVTRLQQEAALLDAQAGDVRRRQVALGVVGVGTAPVVRPDGLDHELQRIRDRSGELHQRYVGLSRTWAGRLDEAAPRTKRVQGWWRGAADAADDQWRHGIRAGARAHEWLAVGAGHASLGLGLVAGVVPATAPVAVPVGLVLAGVSVQQRTVLAMGAGGSPDAVLSSLLSTAAGVAGGFGSLMRLGRVSEDTATAAGFALEAGSWADGPGDGTWTARVSTDDGQELDVEVHDMAEPWHTGHGLRGHGFAGVATVTAPRSRAGSPAPASGQRDDEDRVRRRGRGTA